eukprot:9199228-Prorocentrum_lima.AAC.1
MALPKLLLSTDGGRGGYGKMGPGNRRSPKPLEHDSETGEEGSGPVSGRQHKWSKSRQPLSRMTWPL